ncbi:hypothetical protein NQ318_018067 [Aromia moschata]|uniref:Mos1 transposase HTH domain-containing protein n=1 Tax=Aromia moschata TaxID=1265417 RepID=A0AAV8ZDR6_9CUCU|nr:hypothetical protein NQ318_018067 [Aromia moschata]
MIKSAYGDDAMDRSSVFEWHKTNRRFGEGREKIEEDQCSGRPATIKNDENMVKNYLDDFRDIAIIYMLIVFGGKISIL